MIEEQRYSKTPYNCRKNETNEILGKSSVCGVPVKDLKSDCNNESTGIFQN